MTATEAILPAIATLQLPETGLLRYHALMGTVPYLAEIMNVQSSICNPARGIILEGSSFRFDIHLQNIV